MARKNNNYLDYIPVISSKNDWEEIDGKVVIHMVNRGFYNKIAQKFFHTPRVSHIDLDEFGSFVWKNIDGTKSVEDIAQAVKTAFGEKAEPLYDRLVTYIQTLHNNKFIIFKGKDRE